MAQRTRRTNAQIGIALKKERAALYSRRYRLVEKLSDPKFPAKERAKAEKGVAKAQKRLDSIGSKLFKYGKPYGKLKSQRNKLKRHHTYLSKKISTKKMSKEEQKRAYLEIRDTAEAINQVEVAMHLPVAPLASQRTGVVPIKGGKFEGEEVIWMLAGMVNTWLTSGVFTLMVLDDEILDMENPIVVQIQVDQAIEDVKKNRGLGATAHFYFYGDIPAGYLEILVRNYATGMVGV